MSEARIRRAAFVLADMISPHAGTPSTPFCLPSSDGPYRRAPAILGRSETKTRGILAREQEETRARHRGRRRTGRLAWVSFQPVLNGRSRSEDRRGSEICQVFSGQMVVHQADEPRRPGTTSWPRRRPGAVSGRFSSLDSLTAEPELIPGVVELPRARSSSSGSPRPGVTGVFPEPEKFDRRRANASALGAEAA